MGAGEGVGAGRGPVELAGAGSGLLGAVSEEEVCGGFGGGEVSDEASLDLEGLVDGVGVRGVGGAVVFDPGAGGGVGA